MPPVATFEAQFLDPQTIEQIDITWEMARASFESNNNQILINPNIYHKIGAAGVEELKFRLSVYLDDAPIIACKDPTQETIRIMKQPGLATPLSFSSGDQSLGIGEHRMLAPDARQKDPQTALRAFGKKSKVPRPPNAFILYRQHWHPHYKQYNKSMHNNDISKEIGKRWKSEPEHIKKKYKMLAEELKEKHAAQYPDYQYAPRKPGEKKRRMTARKLARLREGQQVQEAASFFSPESIGLTDQDSPCQNLLFSAENDVSSSSLHEFDGRISASPPQPIQYQENDTYTTLLPSSHADIEGEIRKECGEYGVNYFDILEDVGANERPEEHLLHASPGDTFIRNQNEWESLIDWQGLNHSIKIANEMLLDTEDILAAQACGPDISYKSHDDIGLLGIERNFQEASTR